MSTNTDNAQGTLAFASGGLLTAGTAAALTSSGTTQLIAAGFVVLGAAVAVIRAWLRAP